MIQTEFNERYGSYHIRENTMILRFVALIFIVIGYFVVIYSLKLPSDFKLESRLSSEIGNRITLIEELNSEYESESYRSTMTALDNISEKLTIAIANMSSTVSSDPLFDLAENQKSLATEMDGIESRLSELTSVVSDLAESLQRDRRARADDLLALQRSLMQVPEKEWTRADILTAIGLFLTLLGLVVAFLTFIKKE